MSQIYKGHHRSTWLSSEYLEEQAQHCLVQFLEMESWNCHHLPIHTALDQVVVHLDPMYFSDTHAWSCACSTFSINASVGGGKELSFGIHIVSLPIFAAHEFCHLLTWWHNFIVHGMQPWIRLPVQWYQALLHWCHPADRGSIQLS